MERYAYLDSWDKLDSNVFKLVFNYAINIAKNQNKELTLVVNNVAQCSGFINKFLDQVSTNKLSKGNVMKFDDVEISLKSPFSIKSHQNYGVFCAFHPSDKTLDAMENSNNPQVIIILGEKEEHLHSWLSKTSGKLLAQG